MPTSSWRKPFVLETGNYTSAYNRKKSWLRGGQLRRPMGTGCPQIHPFDTPFSAFEEETILPRSLPRMVRSFARDRHGVNSRMRLPTRGLPPAESNGIYARLEMNRFSI